jgi:hypothetical protein
VAIVSLKLWLARRRGHLADVIEQARFLSFPVSGQSDEDIALGSDLRAVALMNLGIVEAWSLGLPDAERHLQEGAVLPGGSAGPTWRSPCGHHHEALEEFSAAEHLQSQLEGSHALASQVTGWMLTTQARLGMLGEAPRRPRGAR